LSAYAEKFPSKSHDRLKYHDAYQSQKLNVLTPHESSQGHPPVMMYQERSATQLQNKFQLKLQLNNATQYHPRFAKISHIRWLGKCARPDTFMDMDMDMAMDMDIIIKCI
jgi:hypothetical protein